MCCLYVIQPAQVMARVGRKKEIYLSGKAGECAESSNAAKCGVDLFNLLSM
jgi:hypothetical protein